MTARATGAFKSTNWDEQTYRELEGGGKLTRTTATFVFSGDIEGEGLTAYLMDYPSDGVVHFVGLEHITGKIGDRAGSFVLQETGTYAPTQLSATWLVVPGSGTGELAGMTGTGGYSHRNSEGEEVRYTLDITFE